MEQKLWNRNFSLLVAGQVLSLFGNMVVTTVLPFHILHISGSAFLYGLAMGLPAISLIIMTPIGGIMADRMRKHRLMLWLDVSVTAIIVAYLIFAGFFAQAAPVIIVKLLAFNAIQAMYMATTAASIPFLAPQDKLTTGNAIIMVANMLAMTGGMAVAGVLYDRLGLMPILVGCAVCFIITAIADLFIRVPYKKQETAGGVIQIVKGDLSAAVRFALKEKPAVSGCIVPVFLLEMVFGSMFVIGVPVLITIHLGMGMTQVGIALAVMMFGGVAGGITAGALGTRLTIPRGLVFVFFGILLSVPMGLVFLFDAPPTLAYAVITASGAAFLFCAKVLSVAVMTYIQSETPPEMMGKILSVLMVVPFVGQSIGYPLQGRLFEALAGAPWRVVFGAAGVMLVVTVAAFVRGRRM